MKQGQKNRDIPGHLVLDDKQKAEFYKSLATMNYIEAAKAIGLNAHYKGDNSLRAASFKLFKSIDPVAVGLAKDTIDIVENAITSRRITPNKSLTDGDQVELLNPDDTKQLVIGGKNKAAMLLHKKFDRLSKNNKMLDEVSLSQLATTFGILFDKSQILKGEATENIAIMAKIGNDMTPEESLDALLKMREYQQEEKHDK